MKMVFHGGAYRAKGSTGENLVIDILGVESVGLAGNGLRKGPLRNYAHKYD
jgi:hypothetical protein